MERPLSRYTLRLLGAFEVTNGGSALEVRSRKSQALIAMLALARGGRRSRAWLQSRLWGSRSPAQAQASLRNELSSLRKVFADTGACPLVADTQFVTLDVSRFDVDVFEQRATSDQTAELLEGLDIRGEQAFEEWLLEQRANIHGVRAASTRSTGNALIAETDSRVADHEQPNICHIGLMPVAGTQGSTSHAASQTHGILDTLAEHLVHFGGLAVLDYRTSSDQQFDAASNHGPDALLRTRLVQEPDSTRLHLQLQHASTGRVLWMRRIELSLPATQSLLSMTKLTNELVDQILSSIVRTQDTMSSDRHVALRIAYGVIQAKFNQVCPDVNALESALDRAFELSPQGVFLAWKAYLTAMRMERPEGASYQQITEQAAAYSRRALELNPYNPLSLSLLTHTHSFVLRDFQRAFDLIGTARDLGSQHILTHDVEALLNLYAGNLDEARRFALIAAHAGRHLPYRYCYVTTLCMIDTLSGDYHSAVRNGELALSLHPHSSVRDYPPVLRYLGAGYSKLHRYDDAARYFERLRKVEPGLSAERVSDRSYPLPSPAASELVQGALREVMS